MNIKFPENTKKIIDSIRNAIGRDVIFNHVASYTECPDCTLNPVTKTSTNSFCTTCLGLYYIPNITPITVKAHVTWGLFDRLNWISGGELSDAKCRIQIEYNELNDSITKYGTSVIVDGKTMYIDKKNYHGVPEINRIVLELKSEE